MEAQLSAPLKPLKMIECCDVPEGFSCIGTTRLPRVTSLSDSSTPDRCSVSSLGRQLNMFRLYAPKTNSAFWLRENVIEFPMQKIGKNHIGCPRDWRVSDPLNLSIPYNGGMLEEFQGRHTSSPP